MSQPYVSCIKVKGIDLMPPLITDEIRLKCKKYREKAIQIEQRLLYIKRLKETLKDLERLEPQTQHITQTIEMQNTLLDQSNDDYTLTDEISIDLSRKSSNLIRETIEVTDYISTNIPEIQKNVSETIPITPSKLIRSNSYILESPSPILLAHLEKEAKRCCDVTSSISEPAQYLIETDIKVEQIKISTPLVENSCDINSFDPHLVEILDKLSPDCASKLVEILDDKNDKNLAHLQDYESWKNGLVVERIDKPLSVTSNQTLYYSVQKTDQMLKIPGNRRYYKNKEEWAASVINAAVRGYLVRRLIKTEKVVNLIETIKDALLCAIQLHGAEVVDEADIELHRRLLQQVSAACYAFHDLFFTLSIKEQMQIIATDRQRILDKARFKELKRNRSRTSTINSECSTSRIQDTNRTKISVLTK